jgi:hypothetical protein
MVTVQKGRPSAERQRATDSLCVQAVQARRCGGDRALRRLQANILQERQHRVCRRVVSAFLTHIRTLQSCYRDTVSSVGVVMSRALPFTNSNSAIRMFRHALSLDEVSFPDCISNVLAQNSPQNRAEFRPNLFHRVTPNEAGGSPTIGPAASSSNNPYSDQVRLVPSGPRGIMSQFRKSSVEVVQEEEGNPTDVLEVWFAGCHGGERYAMFLYLHSMAYLSEDLRRRRIHSA